jgi:hypothetical protein
MPEILQSALPDANGDIVSVLARLILAMALGAVVAFVYRRTRPASEVVPSFTVTLVLLSILIAMVTQVIGDNVARAFSLVGALSIVRFRTVVRDTEDTAFVIFAVAIGMAVGARHPALAMAGLAVVGLAALVMSRGRRANGGENAYTLQLRVGLGHDADNLLHSAVNGQLRSKRLLSMATAQMGMAIEATYLVDLRDDLTATELVKIFNRLEGVQGVSLQRGPIGVNAVGAVGWN